MPESSPSGVSPNVPLRASAPAGAPTPDLTAARAAVRALRLELSDVVVALNLLVDDAFELIGLAGPARPAARAAADDIAQAWVTSIRSWVRVRDLLLELGEDGEPDEDTAPSPF